MNMSSQKIEEYVTALNLMYALYGLRLGDNDNVDGLSTYDTFHIVDDDGNRDNRVKIMFNTGTMSFEWKWA